MPAAQPANAGGSAEGTIAPADQSIMVYTDSEGFYGGAAAKGSSLSPDADANVAYYGQSFTPKEILFENKAKPSEAAVEFSEEDRGSFLEAVSNGSAPGLASEEGSEQQNQTKHKHLES